jgi:hypothetical protein
VTLNILVTHNNAVNEAGGTSMRVDQHCFVDVLHIKMNCITDILDTASASVETLHDQICQHRARGRIHAEMQNIKHKKNIFIRFIREVILFISCLLLYIYWK